MSRKLDYSETDCFVRALMDRVYAKAKRSMLEQLDAVVDWEGFRAVLESIWPCTVDDGGRGRSSWDAVLMLKVFVYGKLQGNLSDAQLEEHCLCNLRVKRFLGLGLERYPDEKTIHKYRSELAKSGRWEELFMKFHEQLVAKGYQIKEGVMIDASVMPSPVQRQVATEKTHTEVAEEPVSTAAAVVEETEQEAVVEMARDQVEEPSEAQQRQLDRDASWVTRPGKSEHGYKLHIVMDVGHKVIWVVEATAANVHDSKMALGVLEKVPRGHPVYGDRGYDSAKLRSELQARGLEPRIAARSRQSNETRAAKVERIETNQQFAKTRVRVEHGFAMIKHNMGCRLHRGIGLARAQSELGLTCLVYNMARLRFLAAKMTS